MRTLVLTLASVLAVQAGGEDPIVRAWLVNPAARTTVNPVLRAILPDVQGVRIDDRYVEVESAGLSLQSLGSLTANDREPTPGPRRFVFRFPRQPQPAPGYGPHAPVDVVGAFLNGVPLYNPISPVSYHDQNLWHLDAVASLRQHTQAESPLLASLLAATKRHSPLIGFALDGYPIYGPYGWDSNGQVRRLRSSYRLRAITRRTTLPDGAELTPAQEGPPVSAEYPLGAFAEDYEYVPGSGDLDQHNGRMTRTPEYPQGTYAYFLATYPYLVGPTYYGIVDQPGLPEDAIHHPPLDPDQTGQIDLITAQPDTLTLVIRDDRGHNIRFLEKVHEQPIHLLVVSTDLAEFAHIHPELQPGDTYKVTYPFPHGGTYWLFADYTRPGKPQSISRFRLDIKGDARPAEPLHPDRTFTKTQDGLPVKLTLPPHLRVGEDVTFRFDVAANDLQPYLGAWAHIMIVSADRRQFIHAHPMDSVPGQHTHAVQGPSPATIQTITGFRQPGLYRLWIQFRRQGNVITVPYTFRVEPEQKKTLVAASIPAGAVRIKVTSTGFEPARVITESGKSTLLAFIRKDAQNCASAVVFPELKIRKPLPVGETVLIEIPRSAPSELHFACGMGMYQGTLRIR